MNTQVYNYQEQAVNIEIIKITQKNQTWKDHNYRLPSNHFNTTGNIVM